MPEFIDGLPLHPLIVHFVVVLLPISVLGAVLIAVWPAVRRRFGWLVVAAAGVGAALVPVATSSGENLAARLPENPLITRHQELGDSLIWWALPLFLAVTALMVLHTRIERATPGREPAAGGGTDTRTDTKTETKKSAGTTVLTIAAAVVTVGIAVGTGIHTYRVGDAGARAVWEGVEDLPPAGNGG